MKYWKKLLLLVPAILLNGCGGPTRPLHGELEQIDSLSAFEPKRAIVMLDSLQKELAEADSASIIYGRLLSIKARDRAYIRHTSDQEILEVIDYYERHPEGDRLAWAYCYGGRVYRDLNDSPRALEYLQKSLEYLADGKNPNLRQRVLSQLGYLFYYQHLFAESRAIKHEVICADSLLGNFDKMVTCYTDIARCFIAEEQFDSASHYAQHARALMHQHQLTHQLATVDLIDAQVAEYQGQHLEAISLMRPYLTDSALSDITPCQAVVCRALMALKQYDEAEALCQHLLQSTTSRPQTKVDAWRHLSAICEARGETKKALTCHIEALNRLDSLVKSEQSEKITLVSSYYQCLQQERKLQQLQLEKNRAETRFYIILSVAIALLLAGGILWLQYKRRQTERLLKQEKALTLFKSSELCQRLYALYYAQRPLPADMWDEIEDFLNDNSPQFLPRLQALSCYSEIERHISILTRLDFRNVEIATLLCKSKSAISLAKKRLYAKVKGKEGKAEDWENLVKEL